MGVLVLGELLATIALLWVGANIVRFLLVSCGGANSSLVGGFFTLSDNWIEANEKGKKQ